MPQALSPAEIRAKVVARLSSGKLYSVAQCVEFVQRCLPQIDAEAEEDFRLVEALGAARPSGAGDPRQHDAIVAAFSEKLAQLPSANQASLSNDATTGERLQAALRAANQAVVDLIDAAAAARAERVRTLRGLVVAGSGGVGGAAAAAQPRR